MMPDPAFGSRYFLPDVQADLTAQRPYVYFGEAKSQEDLDEVDSKIDAILDQANQEGLKFHRLVCKATFSELDNIDFSKRRLWKAISHVHYRGELIIPWLIVIISNVVLGGILGVLRNKPSIPLNGLIQKIIYLRLVSDFCAMLTQSCRLVTKTFCEIKKIDNKSTFIFFSIAYSPSFTAVSNLKTLKNRKNDGPLPTWVDPVSGLLMPENEVRSYRTVILASYAIHHTNLDKAFKVKEGQVFFPLENRFLTESEFVDLEKYLKQFWNKSFHDFCHGLEVIQ